MRPTEGTGYGLLPTPMTMDVMEPKTDKAVEKEMTVSRPGRQQLSNLRDVVVRQPERLLATPNSRDWKGEGGNGKDLNRDIKNMMLPTPTAASDVKGGCTRPNAKRQKDTLAHAMHEATAGTPGTTSQLNPLFVAEMMGFPVNWLELPFLNTEMNQ